MKIKLIIFDLDGVLINSTEYDLQLECRKKKI